MKMLKILYVIALAIGVTQAVEAKQPLTDVRYGIETVDGLDIFYREAGNPKTNKPALVLLHGYPSSSHQYRKLLANLGDQFYLIAPDYPGYGNSEFPLVSEYEYSFDNFAKTMDRFLQQRGLNEYVLMIHDFGAPVGFRIATKHPKKVKGFIVMNGNAYEEGIGSQTWTGIKAYWQNKSPEIEKAIINEAFSVEAMKWQYTHGTRSPENINPDNWMLDYYSFARPGAHETGLAMFYDYQNNVKLYPIWQKFLRDNQRPMLLMWGKNDAYFSESGAEGYKRDVKDLDYTMLNTGHFALEEEAPFISSKIRDFMQTKFK